MMECRRISTSSCSASSCALRSGRTLNPMIMAFDAEASNTSVSVMAPTPVCRTLILTFSLESFESESASTSTEPCTSPLRMIGSSFTPAVFNCSARPSSDRREDLARSEEHTSELQSQSNLVCRLLLEKKKKKINKLSHTKKKKTLK